VPIHALPALLAAALLAAPAVGAAPVMPASTPASELSWGWAPLEGAQDVRVAPLVVAGAWPALEPLGFLGEQLDGSAAHLRNLRDHQVATIPEVFSLALPGELARALPADWKGSLRDARAPARARSQIEAGVDGRRSLEAALQELAGRLQGDVILFQWMSDVSAVPLGTTTAPGTTTRVADRVVFVDQHTDPVLTEATVGLALVAADGEVFLRYENRYQVLITGSNSSWKAGRQLARQLVDDLQPLLTEPALVGVVN